MSGELYAVWPDGSYCERCDLEEFLVDRSDDYVITEALRFDPYTDEPVFSDEVEFSASSRRLPDKRKATV